MKTKFLFLIALFFASPAFAALTCGYEPFTGLILCTAGGSGSGDPTLAGDVTGLGSANTVVQIQGIPVHTTDPVNDGDLLCFNSSAGYYEPCGLGALLTYAGGILNVATETVVQYGSSTTVPPSCDAYGLIYWDTNATAGQRMFYCNGSTYEAIVPATAVALAANGTNCADGEYARGVDASGNAENCTTAGGGTARDNLTNTGGNWDFNPADPSTFYFHEEFANGSVTSTAIGSVGWNMSNIAGTLTASKQASAFPNLGIERFTTSTANSGEGGVVYLGSSADPIMADIGNRTGSVRSLCTMVFRLGQTATTNFRIGFFTSLTLSGGAGFGIRYNSSTDTNFQLLTVSGSADHGTPFDLGVAADTNWHTLQFRTDGTNAARVYFRLDGGTERTIMSGGDHSATPSTGAMFPIANITTLTTAAKFIEMDKFSCLVKVGSSATDRNP